MRRLPFVLVTIGLVASSPALAADGSLHSGRIVAIDATTRRLVLEEMGPWSGEETKPVTHSFEFDSGTKFQLVTRAKGANPQGWIGGYVESTVAPSAIKPGDFATLTVDRGGKGSEAVIVQVIQQKG